MADGWTHADMRTQWCDLTWKPRVQGAPVGTYQLVLILAHTMGFTLAPWQLEVCTSPPYRSTMVCGGSVKKND